MMLLSDFRSRNPNWTIQKRTENYVLFRRQRSYEIIFYVFKVFRNKKGEEFIDFLSKLGKSHWRFEEYRRANSKYNELIKHENDTTRIQ